MWLLLVAGSHFESWELRGLLSILIRAFSEETGRLETGSQIIGNVAGRLILGLNPSSGSLSKIPPIWGRPDLGLLSIAILFSPTEGRMLLTGQMASLPCRCRQFNIHAAPLRLVHHSLSLSMQGSHHSSSSPLAPA